MVNANTIYNLILDNIDYAFEFCTTSKQDCFYNNGNCNMVVKIYYSKENIDYCENFILTNFRFNKNEGGEMSEVEENRFCEISNNITTKNNLIKMLAFKKVFKYYDFVSFKGNISEGIHTDTIKQENVWC